MIQWRPFLDGEGGRDLRGTHTARFHAALGAGTLAGHVAAGMTVHEIAARYGVSLSTATWYLRGVPKEAAYHKSRKSRERYIDAIVSGRLAGQPQRLLAAELGISVAWVSRMAREAGLPYRPRQHRRRHTWSLPTPNPIDALVDDLASSHALRDVVATHNLPVAALPAVLELRSLLRG